MGLLDMFGSSWDDPRTTAALRMAGAIGAGSVGQRRPVSLIGLLGEGMGAYSDTMRQAKADELRAQEAQMRKDEFGLRRQQYEQELADSQAQRASAERMQQAASDWLMNFKTGAYGSHLEAAQDAAFRGISEVPSVKAALTTLAPPAPIKAGKDDRLVLPDGQGGFKTVLDALPEPPKPFTLGPGGRRYDEQGRLLVENPRPAGTVVNVDNRSRQESEESKTVGKYFGEQYANIQKAGLAADANIAKLDRMSQLLQGLQTGRLTPAMKEAQSVLQSLGLPVDVGREEAIEALASQMALEARSPEGGAGMPGAMSDRDLSFLVGMTPGLAKTPEGNRLIIETRRRIAQRDKEVAKLAREYRSKHGSLDEGFYEELSRYSAANPLFDDLMGAASGLGGQSVSGRITQPGQQPGGWKIERVR